MLRLLATVLFLFAFAIATAPLFGQASDSHLVGSIVDATGAAIQNATLELENRATGVKYTTKTASDGSYRFNNIPVGAYKLTASAPGFITSTLQNLQLVLNQTLTANMTVQVGTVATTIDVADAATLIDTTTARVSNTFETRAALDLPTGGGPGGMGVLNLSLLSAGVSSMGGVGYGFGPSIGGQRPTNNNFMIEGVDNNFKSITGPVVRPSNEAVSQFTFSRTSSRRNSATAPEGSSTLS